MEFCNLLQETVHQMLTTIVKSAYLAVIQSVVTLFIRMSTPAEHAWLNCPTTLFFKLNTRVKRSETELFKKSLGSIYSFYSIGKVYKKGGGNSDTRINREMAISEQYLTYPSYWCRVWPVTICKNMNTLLDLLTFYKLPISSIGGTRKIKNKVIVKQGMSRTRWILSLKESSPRYKRAQTLLHWTLSTLTNCSCPLSSQRSSLRADHPRNSLLWIRQRRCVS